MTEETDDQAPRRRGRPAFKPTAAMRRTVEQMKFCGESENTIARALGIDPDTLRKHFVDELANGHAHQRQEVIGMLFTSAKNGNVSAQKKLEELGRVAAAEEAVKGREKPAPKLGKKEERKAAADAVEGLYEPPGGPKLVVDNR